MGISYPNISGGPAEVLFYYPPASPLFLLVAGGLVLLPLYAVHRLPPEQRSNATRWIALSPILAFGLLAWAILVRGGTAYPELVVIAAVWLAIAAGLAGVLWKRVAGRSPSKERHLLPLAISFLQLANLTIGTLVVLFDPGTGLYWNAVTVLLLAFVSAGLALFAFGCIECVSFRGPWTRPAKAMTFATGFIHMTLAQSMALSIVVPPVLL